MGSDARDATERLSSWEYALQESLKKSEAENRCEWIIRCFNSVPSTMDIGREMSSEVRPDRPMLVMAAEQTSGRGRQGRSWTAPEQGFYATWVFAAGSDLSRLAGFSLAVGCVLCDILRSINCAVGLKWPNDIITPDGRKLSGTLVEVVSRGAENYVLTGIGINIAGQPPGVEAAVSLLELAGRSFSPLDLAIWLTPDIFSAWRAFESKGFAAFREKWLKSALYLGSRFTIDLGTGVISGKFAGVDPNGCLLLETDKGLREIAAGHVVKVEQGQ